MGILIKKAIIRMKMHSIYSFWKELISKKSLLKNLPTLGDFPFDQAMFSYIRKGRGFPDFVIKVNKEGSVFTGGEFIKLKTRNGYTIAPFKSVLPSGKAKIKALYGNTSLNDLLQSQAADQYLLEERDVYFLVRGRKDNHQKICVVHGSFFETMDPQELIYKALVQPLDGKYSDAADVKGLLRKNAFNRDDCSLVADIEKASVSLKIQVTAEVTPEGNILNSRIYPQLLDDTINLVIPYHTDDERSGIVSKMQLVMGKPAMKQINVFSIKHPLNGWFVVFQSNL